MDYRPLTIPMNIRILVLCFLAAFIFWLLNSLNKSGYSTKLNYPLEIQYNDSLYIATSPLPKQIAVNLSSTGWDLLKGNFSLNVSPLVYEIANPLTISRLDNAYLMEALSAKLKNAKINYVVADTMSLSFEKKITRKITLKVDSIGIDLQKNFVVASLINLSPSQITLEGPASVLKNYQDTFFIKIPAKNLATNFDDKVSINLPKHDYIKTNADKTLVSFEVAELLK
jgi:hypothetical protein